jgi:hypothetical protein
VRVATLVLSSLVLGGCCILNGDNRFQGDGQLRNRGCWPFENYTLDLGPMDLSVNGGRVFQFSGLPRLEWVVGFSIPRMPSDPPCPDIQNEPWTIATTEVALVQADGRSIFSETKPLRDWTWTYHGGPDEAECRVYSRASYFEPGLSTRYRLVYRVVHPVGHSRIVHGDLRTTAIYTP